MSIQIKETQNDPIHNDEPGVRSMMVDQNSENTGNISAEFN